MLELQPVDVMIEDSQAQLRHWSECTPGIDCHCLSLPVCSHRLSALAREHWASTLLAFPCVSSTAFQHWSESTGHRLYLPFLVCLPPPLRAASNRSAPVLKTVAPAGWSAGRCGGPAGRAESPSPSAPGRTRTTSRYRWHQVQPFNRYSACPFEMNRGGGDGGSGGGGGWWSR